MRRSLTRALGAVLPLLAGLAVVGPGAAPASAATVPAGFVDEHVADVSSPVSIVPLSLDRAAVLDQNGTVRIMQGGALLATPALTLAVCGGAGSERGLLGFATERDFGLTGNVFVYYTRSAPSAPGGCVNRVSRFVMTGNTVLAATETVLLDNISSVNGNHNGGDLEVGNDGYLYVAVGDAGRDPRGDSGSAGANDAAQDGSILNGKILRITTDGAPAPGNPFTGAGTASCATRGATASTPTTTCQEIFAHGLRNPFRIAFDPNTGATRFFVNDVGQGTREEVNEGVLGADYGWNSREGVCPRGLNPPCSGPPAGVTDPITDYPRSVGTYITAGAFVPNGVWPAQYDGAYLFADGGSGGIFVRLANGSVDYVTPFGTGAAGIADMAFVPDGNGASLYYSLNATGEIRRIRWTGLAPQPPVAGLQLEPITPQRVYDSRFDIGTGAGIVRAWSSRMIDVQVPSPDVRAVVVDISIDATAAPGYLQAWPARTPRPETAVINSDAAGQVVSNAAVLPVTDGRIMVSTQSSTHLIVDVLGYLRPASGPTAAGRYVPLDPVRRLDTREPAGAVLPGGVTNASTVVGDHLDVVLPGTAGIPDDGTVSAVAFILSAVSAAGDPKGHATAYPAGATRPNAANVTANGAGDVRNNLVIVPLGAGGAVSLHRAGISDLTLDVAGYVTGPSATASSSGLFTVIGSQRIVDTRDPRGFDALASGEVSTVIAGSGAATAVLQNLALTDTVAPGYVNTSPDDGTPVPFVANINATGRGQIRAALSFTKLPANQRARYFSQSGTHLVVDVYGYVT